MTKKKKEFYAKIIDKEGNTWLFEGHFKGLPIWTMENESKPLLLTEWEAFEVAMIHAKDKESFGVKRA
jgi:hypothetical protein